MADQLPPVREHVRWVWGYQEAGFGAVAGACVMVKTHDAGAADRAASVYARTILKVTEPTVTPHSKNWVKMGWNEIPDEPAVQLRPFERDDRQVVTRRRPKAIQAKHITDVNMLLSVAYLSGPDKRWTFTGQYAELFPEMPRKVIAAKLSILMRRGLLDGCDCGCRGDWYLTSKGDKFLNERLTFVTENQGVGMPDKTEGVSAMASYPATKIPLGDELREGQFVLEGGLSVWPLGSPRPDFRIDSPMYCGPLAFVTEHDDGQVSCSRFFRAEKDGFGPWVRLEHGEWVFYSDEAMLQIGKGS